MSQWNVVAVGDFLQSIGLGHHREAFAAKSVQGADLLRMTPAQFRSELNVKVLGERKALKAAIDSYHLK